MEKDLLYEIVLYKWVLSTNFNPSLLSFSYLLHSTAQMKFVTYCVVGAPVSSVEKVLILRRQSFPQMKICFLDLEV